MDFLADFGVQPVLLLAQIVNFAILLFILHRFLYKPILKVLEERKKKIATSIKQSEEIQQRFEETEKRQTEILEKAQKESNKIIDEAKNEANMLSQQIQHDAKKQAEDTMKKTSQLLALEKEKMITEAKSEIIRLVAITTEKVTEKTLSPADKTNLIEKAVKEIKE